jgi:hypothetical protein
MVLDSTGGEGKCDVDVGCLDEVGNVHGHLLDLGAVELLNLAHHADIVSGDEVDGNTLSSETTTTTDAVDVVLAVGGKVVVDDKGDLLDIDTTGKEVSGDEDTRRSGTELLHDDVTLGLVHVAVHGGDSEVTGSELVGEPVDLSAGVAEDDSLGNGDGLVQVGEGVELPVLLLDGNVELLDTFKGKLILLDQDADGVTHELGGDLEDVLGHGGGQKDDLSGLRQKLEDVVDLLSETARQHLVGLVEDEHLHVVGLEDTTLNHVVDTAGSTDNDLRAVLEGLHVITDAGATNAGVALNLHEVTDGDNDLLDLLSELTGGGEDERLASLDAGVDLLKGGDGEGSRLTGTGLGLGDDIVALDDGHDGALLDSGGALETVGVDTTEKLRLQVHVVEGVGDFIVVGLDLALGHVLKTFVSHDCGLKKRLLVLDRSRRVARGGVDAGDPLDAAAKKLLVVEVKTRYQILCARIKGVSRNGMCLCVVVDLVVQLGHGY